LRNPLGHFLHQKLLLLLLLMHELLLLRLLTHKLLLLTLRMPQLREGYEIQLRRLSSRSPLGHRNPLESSLPVGLLAGTAAAALSDAAAAAAAAAASACCDSCC
jgi:hypothetical protein